MDIVEFSSYIGKLKRVKRTGWVRMKVPEPESVADHSFGLAMLAAVLPRKRGVDQLKVLKMALMHDIGEAVIGDIVTDRGTRVNKKLLRIKKLKERNAINKIFSLTGKNEFIMLFDEFEEGRTPEAKLVRQLDKLEMIIQAHSYENKYKINLEEFYQTGFARIKDKELRKILEILYSIRPKGLTMTRKSR